MTNQILAHLLRTPQEGGDTYIPLEAAVLCAGCGAIFRFARPACPSCGDKGRLCLPAILNRVEVSKPAQEVAS